MVVVAAVGVPPRGRAGSECSTPLCRRPSSSPWTELSCLGLGQNGSDEIIEPLRVLLWVHGGNLCPSLKWKKHEVNALIKAIKGFSHAYTLEHKWWMRCLGEIHKVALCTVLLVQVQKCSSNFRSFFFVWHTLTKKKMFFCRNKLFNYPYTVQNCTWFNITKDSKMCFLEVNIMNCYIIYGTHITHDYILFK